MCLTKSSEMMTCVKEPPSLSLPPEESRAQLCWPHALMAVWPVSDHGALRFSTTVTPDRRGPTRVHRTHLRLRCSTSNPIALSDSPKGIR